MVLPFKPAFWPTVVALPAFLVLLALGTWQLDRLAWKTELNATREAAATAPPVPLPQNLDEARRVEFRRVAVGGVFAHDQERYVGATSEGGQTGFHVMTPLRLPDGRTLLVNRGFVPSNLKDPARRAEGQLTGTQTVEGLVRIPPAGKPGWFAPENYPDANMWFWVDTERMAPGSLPFYIDAVAAPVPGGWPRGGTTRLRLPNDHLQYALTWYLLAVALAAIYVVWHVKRP